MQHVLNTYCTSLCYLQCTDLSEVCSNVMTSNDSCTGCHGVVPCEYAKCSGFASTCHMPNSYYRGSYRLFEDDKMGVANKGQWKLTVDSKQAKTLSTRYGQTDTIYSPLSWLDPTTTQMRRVDLVSYESMYMYSYSTALTASLQFYAQVLFMQIMLVT